MVHHESRIPLKFGVGATIFVFGDRQEGSPGFNREAWAEFKREFLATPNAWALGLGDYGDWLRPSMRTRLLAPLQHDDSAKQQLDTSILKVHDGIIDSMDFLKGRLIGLHEGHHNWTLSSGINLDQRLASALKAPFLGWTAATRLVLNIVSGGKNLGQTFVYTMLSTHGNASGRKVHTALAWMESSYMASWVADHYIMGHGCKNLNAAPFQRNEIRRTGPLGVDYKTPRALIVGGFCTAYTNGWQSDYVERAGMSPQPMGYGIIRFHISNSNAERVAHGRPPSGAKGSKSLRVEQVNRTLTPDD